MPLYNTTNMPQMAQAAMSGATQAAASQTKETKTVVKKDNSLMNDIYKGAAAVAYVGKGLEGLTDAAKTATDLWDQHKLRNAYEDVDKAYREGGWGAVEKLDDNFWHGTAIGRFAKDRAESEKGKLEMLKNMDAVAEMKYKDIRPLAMQATKFFQSGNMEQFMPLMQTISEKAAMPIRLKPTGNGNFQIMFRSDEKGGWTENGTMAPEAAFSELQKYMRGEQMIMRGINGELLPVNKEANLYMIKSMWASYLGNADNRIDPKKLIPLYDRNGNVGGFGRIQNPLPSEKDPDAYMKDPQIQAYGINGQGLGTFNGYEGIMKHGLSPFAPQKGKGGAGGGGGTERIGPKNQGLHFTLSQNGYAHDKGRNAYYEFLKDKETGQVQTDEKGNPLLDYNKPLTNDALNLIMNRTSGKGGGGQDDGLGLRQKTKPSHTPSQDAGLPQQEPPLQEMQGLGLPPQAAPGTFADNFRGNLDRQQKTRDALLENGNYDTEFIGLPGLGINKGAMVSGDNYRGEGMFAGIGADPRHKPFGERESDKWRQRYGAR